MIIEIVGAAGTGKTTLVNALRQLSHEIELVERLNPNKIKNAPIFARAGLLLLPMLLRQLRQKRSIQREEVKSLIYLTGMGRNLEGRARAKSLLLLDQGPVYYLGYLRIASPLWCNDPSFAARADDIYDQWARILRLVVWLDASDDVLVERISAREKWHAVKQRSAQEARDFLHQYRLAYSDVLSKLTTYAPIRLLPLRTDQLSVEATAHAVVETVNCFSST